MVLRRGLNGEPHAGYFSTGVQKLESPGPPPGSLLPGRDIAHAHLVDDQLDRLHDHLPVGLARILQILHDARNDVRAADLCGRVISFGPCLARVPNAVLVEIGDTQ